MKTKNLLIPVAADKIEYDTEIPYWMDFHPNGGLMIIKSIEGLALENFDAIYITILKKHDEKYDIGKRLFSELTNIGVVHKSKLVILDNSTSNQPATIAITIEKERIKGLIVVKDVDNSFSLDMISANSIAVFPLDELKFVNPSDKSYVLIDENQYISNIIEKKIISRYFSAGLYCFESARIFLDYYNKLKHIERLYMSHIVYAMLLDKIMFRPIKVKNYLDWGTKEEWINHKNNYQTIIFTLDTFVSVVNSLIVVDEINLTEINLKINDFKSNKMTKILFFSNLDSSFDSMIKDKFEEFSIRYDDIIYDVFPDNIKLYNK